MTSAQTTEKKVFFRQILGAGKQRRLKEYLTAYLFIAPALILIFTFGIFPVGFALYVSLHKWRIKQGEFLGLGNYTVAIDTLAYILAFALALGALAGVVLLLRRIYKRGVEHSHGTRIGLLALPALLSAGMAAAFLRWFYVLLPEFLGIADKLKGLERTQEVFLRLAGEALRAESVTPAWNLFLILLAAALAAGIAALRIWRSPHNLVYQTDFALAWLALAAGVGLGWFTCREIAAIYAAALEKGVDPGIWPQVVTISAGVVLLAVAWWVWRSAERQNSMASFWLRILSAAVLLVGGWMLIGQIPMVVAAGDKGMWNGLKVTLFFAVGTVPFQLAIALFISVLLFQRLAGSNFFRIVYFLPYVTPAIASAAVFKQMFSPRETAPINMLFKAVGLQPQQWLNEPDGIFTLLSGALGLPLPEWAAGPSLALLVIILHSVWTFVGYDVVIYLAGLGNISTELMDAAEVDGANKWEVFRFIIFPLLSPTTYFLSLMAIIGTFKAFNTIWLFRSNMISLGTTDTFSVVIFLEFFEKLRYGYASALAFVLFAIILCLTYINNKVQGSKVFYG